MAQPPPYKRSRTNITIANPTSSKSTSLSIVEIPVKLYTFDTPFPDAGILVEPHKEVEPGRPVFYVLDDIVSSSSNKKFMILSLPAINKFLRYFNSTNIRDKEALRMYAPLLSDAFGKITSAFDLLHYIRPCGLIQTPTPGVQVYAESARIENARVNLVVAGVYKNIPNYWGRIKAGDIVGWRIGKITSKKSRNKKGHYTIIPHVGLPSFAPTRVQHTPPEAAKDIIGPKMSVDWLDENYYIEHGGYAAFGRVNMVRGDSPTNEDIYDAMWESKAAQRLYKICNIDIEIITNPLKYPRISSAAPSMREKTEHLSFTVLED